MATESTTNKGKRAKAKKQSKTSNGVSLIAILKDSRSRTVGGLLLIGISIFLTAAFISFLIVGNADESQATLSFSESNGMNNWMGEIGARTAKLFIRKSFGISAFLIPFVTFLLGFRISFRFSLLPFWKSLRHVLFMFYWLPISMAFLFSDSTFVSGQFGVFLHAKFSSLTGELGTALVIIFSAVAYLTISFGFTIDGLVKFFKKKDEVEEAFKEEDESILTPIADITIQTNEIDLKAEREKEIESEPEPSDKLQVEDPIVEAELPIITPEQKPTAESKQTVENPDESIAFQIEEVEQEEELKESAIEGLEEYDPKLDLSMYKYPPLDLLEAHGSSEINVNRDELEANKNRIVQTLSNYNIAIDKVKATIGPTVTLYEIIPAPGIRISKIKNLEDDIALSLAALGIRIIAPIPGKGTIGIEVPNSNPDTVSMRSVIASEKFQNSKMDLPIALGKTISNETFVTDLAKMPHLLMAGATGQGKSVGLNAVLASILYRKHPAQVKFVLVDPKKVELTLYNKIERHFLAKLPDSEDAIITDTSKVVSTLNSLCVEMDERYDLLKKAMVRNLKEYNAKFIARKLNPKDGHRYMPFIILVVDEFADLMMTAGKEVETPIARLAQLARAIGIHLIIATQRPSVNIITGTIKANFPARIAFRVTSKIDSRTILDSGGAEQLIGRGDMLLSTGSDLIRLQCAFLDTPEVENLCEYIGGQQGYPDAYLLPEIVETGGGSDSFGADAMDRDVMFEEAARIVVTHQQGSASLLQRRLKLGYNRAGRIVDQLEAAGIIGPFEGSKARQVLIPDEISLEQLLGNQ
jgi:S-DNA-T family DNA segregation ATPase FtsK/SpoIIIE